MFKILIIEDDLIISNGLKKAFEYEQYNTIQAHDGEEGVYIAKTQNPDLIILDVMMPYLNGFEVVTELRRVGENVPIILLSARVHKEDKIRGLDLGADDYVEKPFDLDELLARVRRFLNKEKKIIRIGNCTYDSIAQKLMDEKNNLITINAKERLLIEYFVKHQNMILTREQIILAVWGDDYDGTDRTVDNFILNLRKKIGKENIITERGAGYRFVMKSMTVDR